MRVYLSTSWKNRRRVRALAQRLRTDGHEVYDFTDPDCRGTPEIPPERFPEEFDPEKHIYREYIHAVPEWKEAVLCNMDAILWSDVVVLMLPCGNDAHADAFLGLGRGRDLVICGQPRKGERTPTHMWTDLFVDSDEDIPALLKQMEGVTDE